VNSGCSPRVVCLRGERRGISPHEAKCMVVCMRCWTPVRRCKVGGIYLFDYGGWSQSDATFCSPTPYTIFFIINKSNQIPVVGCRRAVPYSCSLRRSRRRRLFRDTLLSPKRHIKRDEGSTSWYPCNPLHTTMLTHQIINCKKYVYIVSNYFHLTFKIFHCFL
jgi:hypothetical protein